MLSNLLLNNPASADKLYVEDVFSTYLYAGAGTGQSINNGIDLAGKGGMVWIKSRVDATLGHFLFDTARGVGERLASNSTAAQASIATNGYLNAFNSNGFTVPAGYAGTNYNNAGYSPYVSWTFRKAPKFFDVVTYTGNGSDQNIAHNLGVTPGFVTIKRLNTTGNWSTWHRSIGNNYLILNTTAAQAATGNSARTVTDTTFQIYGNFPDEGASGSTYVAYLFAHDTTSDGIIQCGSYTGNGSATGPVINLGWEPQWVMIKRAEGSSSNSWNIYDAMRGMSVAGVDPLLIANTTTNESGNGLFNILTATETGFQILKNDSEVNANGWPYIYIAIRRGPMRTPTSGTSVFSPVVSSAATGTTVSTNFPIDSQLIRFRGNDNLNANFADRLRGISSNSTEAGYPLVTSSTSAEQTAYVVTNNWGNTSFNISAYYNGANTVYYSFRRAPSFFDVVCYSGDGTNGRSLSHSLGTAPEMVIVKDRDAGGSFAWFVGHKDISSSTYQDLQLRSNAGTGSIAVNAFPSSLSGYSATSFIVNQAGLSGAVNGSGTNYVAYLFATCPGVSKVGSYTGNGSSQTINCGFAAGARFVLIKRTDSTGDWYVWDTARGIVEANDPHLSLNSTAAEVTTNDTIDPDNTGFVVNQNATTNVNVNSAKYIYLAIA